MTKITAFFPPSHKGTSSKKSKSSTALAKRVREGVASDKKNQQPEASAATNSLSKRARVGEHEQREVDGLLSHLNDDDDTESLEGSAANNQAVIVSDSASSINSIKNSSDYCVSSWKKALAKHFESASFASLAKFVAAERSLSTHNNSTEIYPAAADTWRGSPFPWRL